MAEKKPVSIGGLAAIFYDLKLPIGLNISKVQLKAAQATIDKDPFKLIMPEPGDLEAKVDGPSIAAFLNKQAPGGLKDFQVEIESQKLRVTATAKMVFDIKAKAVCTLRIFEGRQLYVDLESVDVMGVGAHNLVQQQLDKVNPIVDVAQFPLEVKLEDVSAQDGFVTLRGKATWR